MTQPLDLDQILARAEYAYDFVKKDPCADGFLPLSVREHFNYDVPALIGALRHRGAQLNLVGLAVNLPADQATTDTAPYSSADATYDRVARTPMPWSPEYSAMLERQDDADRAATRPGAVEGGADRG